MTRNPYATYKQQSVMTMTPGQMLIAVFDELIKQLNIAKISFESNNLTEINRSLLKAQKIIAELRTSLNFDYEISKNLNDIYNFLNRAFFRLGESVPQSCHDLKDIIKLRGVFLHICIYYSTI